MTTASQETPFVKQLADSDRLTREKALSSLQTYLSSGRPFTDLELLKIWKGLFFCIFHTDLPLPQQHLTHRLSSLLLSLPPATFLPFLHAFYSTLLPLYPSIPSLRLDKYLYLIRQYIHHSFLYLSHHNWNPELVSQYLNLMEELPLNPSDGKVPDGVRYHVCDVWVDGLVGVEGWREMEEVLMRPVRRLEREGRTRVVRGRAAEVLGDGRLSEGDEEGDGSEEDEEGEFEGFGE